MEEVSKYIYEYFKESPVFKEEMKDKVYPLFVSEQKEFPFMVYNIGESPQFTRDARNFPITLTLCYLPKEYFTAIRFADKMKELVDLIPSSEFVSTQTIFDDENQYIFINIHFNLIR